LQAKDEEDRVGLRDVFGLCSFVVPYQFLRLVRLSLASILNFKQRAVILRGVAGEEACHAVEDAVDTLMASGGHEARVAKKFFCHVLGLRYPVSGQQNAITGSYLAVRGGIGRVGDQAHHEVCFVETLNAGQGSEQRTDVTAVDVFDMAVVVQPKQDHGGVFANAS
jgi:hypothetical protein